MADEQYLDEFEYELVREGGGGDPETTVVLPVTVRVYAWAPPARGSWDVAPEGETFEYEAHVEGQGIPLTREEEAEVLVVFLRRMEDQVDPTDSQRRAPGR